MPHVHVNRVRLFYEDHGAGEPLVLVHGGFSDHNNFGAVIPGLAESFRVVAYDRRGHSLSDRPEPLGTRRDQEDDLAALIEALGLGPAHVVGTSFGSAVAPRPGRAAARPRPLR
jgi:pimeloyl-ACP methyl ester carboxylesterase